MTLHRILERLRLRNPCHNVPPITRPMRPVVFGRNGRVRIPDDTRRQLEHLHSLGFLYREQMEAAAGECCELLGIDPSEDTCEADWARGLVLDGSDLIVVLNRVSQLREAAEVQEQKG